MNTLADQCRAGSAFLVFMSAMNHAPDNWNAQTDFMGRCYVVLVTVAALCVAIGTLMQPRDAPVSQNLIYVFDVAVVCVTGAAFGFGVFMLTMMAVAKETWQLLLAALFASCGFIAAVGLAHGYVYNLRVKAWADVAARSAPVAPAVVTPL